MTTATDLESFKNLYEGKNSEGFDTVFKPFTEYFYRVIAYNSQGESASDWLLVRTPETQPFFNVDISLLEVAPVSGYQIEVIQIKRFCVYCNIYLYQSEPVFTGIVVSFELIVQGPSSTARDNSSQTQTFTFYCLQSCNVVNDLPSNDSLISILNDQYDSRLDSFFIDVTPITTYNLKMRVCNSFKCATSKG